MADPAYVLGHSERELERLSRQARLVAPVTRRYFLEAGVGPGMRVLDIGSGAGDTAFLAAELVGSAGEVIGTDRVPVAIATATRRAATMGLRNVSFREGDPADLTFEQPFDAVVGRYVLVFQPDPAAMLRQLARHLRPGGAIVFHEPQWEDARSVPPTPTFDRCCHWIREVFHPSDTPTWNLSARLNRAFTDAGLPAPSMRMQTFIGGGAECMDWLQATAELVSSVLPEIERLGLATAAEVEADTLTERMRQEVTASGGIVIGRSEIGLWSNKRASG